MSAVKLSTCEELFAGVSFEAPFDFGMRLNLTLKIPTRILLRLTEFSCRDFPKLYNKVKKFEWRTLIPHGPIRWNVSAAKSRIMVERKIEETCQFAYKEYCEGFPEKKVVTPFSPEVFVRFYEDHCTISLDTSGEALYRRGYRARVSQAPLRETLAAVIWQWLKGDSTEPIELIDPVAGSGTLLFEALVEPLVMHMRPFAYESFSNCPEELKAHNWKLQVSGGLSTQVKQIHALDVDPKMRETVLSNLEELKSYFQRLKKAKVASAKESLEFLDQQIQVLTSDLLETSITEDQKYPRWIVANPPYGERLKTDISQKYYERLLTQMEQKWNPERIGVLLPDEPEAHVVENPKLWASTSTKHNWKLVIKKRIKNGGLSTIFYRFDRIKE